MELKLRDLGKLLKCTSIEWNKKEPFRQSAVIAYYAVFSMPGLLVLIISIAGYFFGRDVVNENILAQVSGTMGADTASQIRSMLAITTVTKPTLWGTLFGILILLMGATGVFVELQKSLNGIWKVEAVPQKGMLPIIKARLFSFGLILAIAFLLVVSLVVSTALVAMSHWIKVDTSDFMVVVFNSINFVISLMVISALFGLIYKILPDAKVQWKHVWLGSLITGLLFTLGKTLLSLYFGLANPGSAYGAAGSVILILLWVSYSSMILFFGAEFTANYADLYSGKVAPTEIAKVTKQQSN